MRATRITVSSDKAIACAADDKFGMAECAERFAVLIEEGQTPFVLAVKGEWGSGKSSLINLVIEHLRKSNNYHINEFDAWRYRQESNLSLPLVAGLAKQLKDPIYKRLAKPLLQASLLAGSLFAKPLAGYSDIKEILKDSDLLLADYEKTKSAIDEYQEQFQHLMEAISNRTMKKKVVIVIDNLDRCLPDDALNLLEQIQNFFKVPGVVFLIALDESAIAVGLKKRFGDFGAMQVQSYLDKIIDLGIFVPEIGPAHIAEYIHARLSSRFVDPSHAEQLKAKLDGWRDERFRQLHMVRSACNLRKVNRVTNLLAACIANDWGCVGDLQACYAAIYLRLYYPEVVALLEHKQEFALEFLSSWRPAAKIANIGARHSGREELISKFGQAGERMAADRACLMLTAILYTSAQKGANPTDYMRGVLSKVERYMGMGVGPHG